MEHAKLLCLIYCPSFVLVSPWNIKACSPQTLDISFKCSCHSEIATVISCNFALSVPSLFGATCRSWKRNTNRLQGSIQQGGECPSSEPTSHLTIYLTPRVGVLWQNCVANNWIIILRMSCWRSLQNKQLLVMLCGILTGSCWFRSIILTCTGTCHFNAFLKISLSGIWGPIPGHFESPAAEHSCSSAHPDHTRQVSLSLAGPHEGWRVFQCARQFKKLETFNPRPKQLHGKLILQDL